MKKEEIRKEIQLLYALASLEESEQEIIDDICSELNDKVPGYSLVELRKLIRESIR